MGDIGPKMSNILNTDNGFLLMDHVRIPREQMLMGLAQVSVMEPLENVDNCLKSMHSCLFRSEVQFT